jgi:hypothetical protein
MQLFSADARVFLKRNLTFFAHELEKLKKPPSKVAYFSFCSAVLVLPKSARSAQTVENSHSFFNVSYT